MENPIHADKLADYRNSGKNSGRQAPKEQLVNQATGLLKVEEEEEYMIRIDIIGKYIDKIEYNFKRKLNESCK